MKTIQTKNATFVLSQLDLLLNAIKFSFLCAGLKLLGQLPDFLAYACSHSVHIHMKRTSNNIPGSNLHTPTHRIVFKCEIHKP